jgi:dimethylhistidine N-methyltransferase
VERYLTPDDLDKALRRDVADGLTAVPKTLPPKWFYDERGSTLFEEITRLPEYYPTRRERAILAERAAEIAAATGAQTLLELGAGSGEKTRLLLDALAGTLRTYVPVDVSGDFLAVATRQLAADYPDLAVHAVVADYERHLHLLPAGGRRLIAFLGGTIGNMPPAARIGFLGALRASMADGDALLLGADLVKDADRLVAAYDDAQGVTAEFNRNVLHVINRELAADFATEAFEHVAAWDPENEWIEMRLRATRRQSVSIGQLDMRVEFAAGEELRTEISAKFRRERLERDLGMAGLNLDRWWTDAAGDFALVLARPAEEA